MRAAAALVCLCACGKQGPEVEGRDASTASGVIVQHGTTMLTGRALDVPITPVDPLHAFVVITVAVDSTDPSNGLIAGQLAPDHIQLIRTSEGSTPLVAWHVVEWPAMFVFRRTEMPLATQRVETVQIAPIAAAFPLVTASTTSTRWSGDEFVRARFASRDQLELSVRSGQLPDRIDWQVVTVPDGGSLTPDDLTLRAIEATEAFGGPRTDGTFPLATWRVPDAIDGIGSSLLGATLTPPVLERQRVGVPVDATVMVVTIPGARVQAGATDFGAADLERDVPIAPVALDRTFALTTGNQRFGETPSPGDQIGVASFAVQLPDSATLRLTRAVTDDVTARVTWAVVELP